MLIASRRNLRGRRSLGAFAAVLALVALGVGCGGSSSPSSVSSADLAEDGRFWLSLNDDLKRELAGICHDKQVKEASSPEEALFVQELDLDSYVNKINGIYEDEEADESIEAGCEQAKVDLAKESFNQLAPQLRGERK